MKILYHHRTASSDGQAVHIEELITALTELGHEVRVVGPAAVSGDAMGQKLGWVHRLKALAPKPAYELLELAYSFVAYSRLTKAVAEFKPDIIYERYNLYMVAGALIRRRHHLPLLLEVNAPLVFERSQHGGLGLPALARWAEGMVWRAADRVLPVTRVLAEHVEAYGVPSERICVIANGINQSHFDHAPALEMAKSALHLDGRLVLGFTGFIRDWHRVDKVIRWLASGRAPKRASLLVVGDGPVRVELEQLALTLGVSERVVFTGVIPRSQVPDYVAAFDIALQPAVTAYASPLKLFEYLALGKAILAPNTPNLREVLDDGGNAMLFSPDAEDGLELALDRLCGDQALRQRLGAQARATIDERSLTWLGNAQKVVGLAEELLRQKRTDR
jgi:glycosyltransferase involved in cell wall biosynthesis